MQKYVRGLSVAAALLGLGAFFLAAAHGRDDDVQEKIKKTNAAKEAVLKLAGDIGAKEGDVKTRAADVAAQHEIEFVMNLFKPRTTSPDKVSGLGVGAKPGAFKQDSIELELIELSNPKKLITKADLTSHQADLQKMAEATLAVAELTPHYAPKKDEEGKPIKDWVKFSADMQKQSKDLLSAVKSGDPKMVQKAALNLNSSCNGCHTQFRD
jgi:soluble cytochrome b562